MPSWRTRPRAEVEHGLLRRRSRHTEGPAEAYDFNIKIYGLRPPEGLHRLMTPDEVDERFQIETATRLGEFVDMLRSVFPWVLDAYPTGRMGGWLTVIVKPGEEVFDSRDELRTVTGARRRLFDVEVIEQKIEREKRNLARDAAENDFWAIRKQDWRPGKAR